MHEKRVAKKSVEKGIIIFLVVMFAVLISTPNSIMAKSVMKTSVRKTTGLKAVAQKDTIKLSWKKAKGAKKYEVYRATKKNGKYTKIKTTSKRTYIDRKGAEGKTYYYKVRGYKVDNKKKRKGMFSTIRKATLPSKPILPTQPTQPTQPTTPTNSGQSDEDFELGEVMISLKGQCLGLSLAELFPELDLMDEASEMHPRTLSSSIDINDKSRTGTNYLLKLKDNTKEGVLEAIKILEQSPYVGYAHPNYTSKPC